MVDSRARVRPPNCSEGKKSLSGPAHTRVWLRRDSPLGVCMLNTIRNLQVFASQVRTSAKLLKAISALPSEEKFAKMPRDKGNAAVKESVYRTATVLGLSGKTTAGLLGNRPIDGVGTMQLSNVGTILRRASRLTPFVSSSTRAKLRDMSDTWAQAQLEAVTSLHIKRGTLLENGSQFDRWAQRGAKFRNSLMEETASRLRDRDLQKADVLGEEIGLLNRSLSGEI